VLSEIRVADYRRLVWPARVPRILSGWTGVFTGALIPAALLVAVAAVHAGWGGIVSYRDQPRSPYSLVPYPFLVGVMLAACVFSLAVMGVAARRYWREVGGTPGRFTARAVLKSAWYAATLRYLRGGGQECSYPEDDVPSPARRYLHSFVAYGFGLCVVSTAAAAILQDLLGEQPPYPFISVPVIAGTLGGIGLIVGCAALLVLKSRASTVTGAARMTVKDYGLLVALLFLALSGIAVLLTRDTAAYGIVLLVHLAAVAEAFAMAPYSKFVHIVFRGCALIRDNLERDAARPAAG
jgi:citrate/tricarballylate utilization protein